MWSQREILRQNRYKREFNLSNIYLTYVVYTEISKCLFGLVTFPHLLSGVYMNIHVDSWKIRYMSERLLNVGDTALVKCQPSGRP